MTKSISYQSESPYYTSGQLSDQTQAVWIICHGYGQMAEHFMRRFDVLDMSSNYIIAPQGPDRFYMNNFAKVGASWTTREEKQMHLDNQQCYLDTVFETETAGVDWTKVKLHIFGFSQGVSVITRWAVHRKLPFDSMIMWAGGFPPELTKDKWSFLKEGATILVVAGDEDQYINEKKLQQQRDLLSSVFDHFEVKLFKGTHEVKREVLQDIIVES